MNIFGNLRADYNRFKRLYYEKFDHLQPILFPDYCCIFNHEDDVEYAVISNVLLPHGYKFVWLINQRDLKAFARLLNQHHGSING